MYFIIDLNDNFEYLLIFKPMEHIDSIFHVLFPYV